ncbi:MAG: hypothetical protein RMK94_12105 [Armatimonadota bacterium]|nr:hypothetical protein [Armatimonadota bacterium]
MKKLCLTQVIVVSGLIWLVLSPLKAQELSMMSREQAASILQQILRVGNYPGDFVWKTVADLPNQIEVDFYDSNLQSFLLEQGKNPVFTMKPLPPTWYEVQSPFNDAYFFPLGHTDLRGSSYEAPDVLVNAWSGRVKIDLPDILWEKTNTERGLGSLPPLTREQQRARALEIMRTLYGEGTYIVAWEVYPSDIDPADYGASGDRLPDEEYFSFFIIYKVDPFTGARLLTQGLLMINARTGALEGGEFVNRPVNISTKPTISESEARQIALNFIQQRMSVTFQGWLHGYQGGGKKIGDTLLVGHVDEGLFVVEDGLLEQHLIWMFPFKMTLSTGRLSGGVISVNAHTGEIMLDFQANLEVTKSQWRRRKSSPLSRYQVPFVSINGSHAWCFTPLQLIGGQLYLAAKYVDNLGTHWDGHRIQGKRGAFEVDVLKHHGQIYLPFRIVCQVSGIRLWWDNERKIPILRAEWLEPRNLLAQRR